MSVEQSEWDHLFIELYGAQFLSLVTLARRCVWSDAVAEEVVQDAFLKLHAAGQRARPGKELNYLRSIVLNSARSATRRQARGDELSLNATVVPSISVEDHCMGSFESEALCDAIASLTHRQQQVVTLRYVCGLTEGETAAELEISAGSVKSHAYRGKARLRSQLVAARGPASDT